MKELLRIQKDWNWQRASVMILNSRQVLHHDMSKASNVAYFSLKMFTTTGLPDVSSPIAPEPPFSPFLSYR